MQQSLIKKSQAHTFPLFFLPFFSFFWAKPPEEQAVLQNTAASIYLNISGSCCHVPMPHPKSQQIISFIFDTIKETRMHSTEPCRIFLELYQLWACEADFHQLINFNCPCPADCRTGVFNQVWPKHSWFIPLKLWATQTAAPGLWVSDDFFRQRGWRMMGSSWGIRVFLLTPRGGIVGVFLMVPVDLLLPWAPSGRCSELPLYGEFGMWLLSPGREASSTTHGSVLYTLCVQGPSHPLLYIRGAPMPSCSWRSFPSLWGGLWYPRNAGFISVVVCC